MILYIPFFLVLPKVSIPRTYCIISAALFSCYSLVLLGVYIVCVFLEKMEPSIPRLPEFSPDDNWLQLTIRIVEASGNTDNTPPVLDIV